MQLEKLINDELLERADDDILSLIRKSSNTQDLINELLKVILETRALKTKEQIIKIFHFPKRKFEDLVRDGKIPHVHITNKIRLFDINQVSNYLNSQKIAS